MKTKLFQGIFACFFLAFAAFLFAASDPLARFDEKLEELEQKLSRTGGEIDRFQEQWQKLKAKAKVLPERLDAAERLKREALEASDELLRKKEELKGWEPEEVLRELFLKAQAATEALRARLEGLERIEAFMSRLRSQAQASIKRFEELSFRADLLEVELEEALWRLEEARERAAERIEERLRKLISSWDREVKRFGSEGFLSNHRNLAGSLQSSLRAVDLYLREVKEWLSELEELKKSLESGLKKSEELSGFFVVCNQYFASRVQGELKLSKHVEPLILAISGEAAKSYPKSFFSEQAKFSIPVEVVVSGASKWLEIDGALLLEALRVFKSLDQVEELFSQTEEGLHSISILEVSGLEGSCSAGEAPDCKICLEGKRIVRGWPEEMVDENFDLAHQAGVYFDCLLPTALYEEWDSPKIYILRYFQDEIMMGSLAGRRLLSWIKPQEAALMRLLRSHPWFKRGAAFALDQFVSVLLIMDPYSSTTKKKFDFLFKGAAFLLSPWLPEQPSAPAKRGVDFIF